MKKIALTLALIVSLTACATDADVASENINKDADNFKIVRRIVFYNGITDNYILEITGNCNIEIDEAEDQFVTTCKLGDDQFKKHYLGLSDNVTYFVEQIESADVSTDHYKVVFKPSVIVPDVEVR